MTPWATIAAALTPGDGDPEVNVYPAWAEADMVAPAVVVQPDEPWMEPHAFGFDMERYVVVCAIQASAGRLSGLADLYRIVLFVLGRVMAVEGLAYETVGLPVVDESTGTPYLAATVRLTYRRCDDAESP